MRPKSNYVVQSLNLFVLYNNQAENPINLLYPHDSCENLTAYGHFKLVYYLIIISEQTIKRACSFISGRSHILRYR